MPQPSPASIVKPRPEAAIPAALRDLHARVAQLEGQRPIFPQAVNDHAYFLPVPATSGEVFATSAPVPNGYTSAAVIMAASFAVNRSGGGGGDLTVEPLVNGVGVSSTAITFPTLGSAMPGVVAQTYSASLTGLVGGGTVRLSIIGQATGTWDVNGASAYINALILFLR